MRSNIFYWRVHKLCECVCVCMHVCCCAQLLLYRSNAFNCHQTTVIRPSPTRLPPSHFAILPFYFHFILNIFLCVYFLLCLHSTTHQFRNSLAPTFALLDFSAFFFCFGHHSRPGSMLGTPPAFVHCLFICLTVGWPVVRSIEYFIIILFFFFVLLFVCIPSYLINTCAHTFKYCCCCACNTPLCLLHPFFAFRLSQCTTLYALYSHISVYIYINMYIKRICYTYIQTFAPICCIPSFNLDIFPLLLLLVYIYSAYFTPFPSSDFSHYPHYSLRFDFNLFYFVFVCHTLPLFACNL